MNWYDPDLSRSYELYHKGDIADGMAACERLLSRPGLPGEIELLVRRNQTWHCRALARAGQGSFNEPPYWRDTEITAPAWVDGAGVLHDTSFNPSIAEHGGRTLIIVRSANYHIVDGRYVVNRERITGSEQTMISTVNHLWDLDPQTLEIINGRIIDDAGHRGNGTFPVEGHEDCRLFWHDEYGWMYSATVRDRSGELCVAQMIEARLEAGTDASVTSSRLLSDQRRHEKNWMPWPWGWGGGSGYVYSVEPTVIVDTFFENPRRDAATRYQGIHLLRHCRGGTQVIPWEGGLSLCLVHEVVEFDAHRVYTHRLIALDRDGRVAGYSLPFTFRGMGIEFAAGLVLRETEAIISYGVGDERAYLLRLPIEELTGMLHMVDEGERWCA